MSRAYRWGWLCLWPALGLLATAADEPLTPASRLVPQEAVIVLEVAQPKDVLDLALGSKMTSLVTAQPAFKMLSSQPSFQQFEQILKYVEMQLGTDYETGLRKLVGGGVTLAIAGENRALLIVDSEDAGLLQKIHKILVDGARDDAAKKGQPNRIESREYQGVTTWTFGGEEAHALLGKRLIVASKGEVLKAALDLRNAKDGASLATLPAYQAAKKAAGKKAATAYVNMTVMKNVPQLAQALKTSGNPFGTLLLATVMDSLRESSWLALGLSVRGETLALEATTDGKPADGAPATIFMTPAKPEQGALPLLTVPRQLASASLFRDLHAFYAAKDNLFPERTSGLILFENMMGIFFSGRDLTQEILGETLPETRIVVAAQQYDPKIGTPQYQVPAFAMVFHLRHPEEFQAVAEEAWQKAIGLTAFTRGQRPSRG